MSSRWASRQLQVYLQQTPFERALAKTVWKQYTSKGKPYYVNSSTKETVVSSPLRKCKQS